MPTYEYVCQSCKAQFERRLSMSQYDSPQTCDCGALGTREISVPNFILSGDGWPGKNNRVQGQMAAKNRVLDQKQHDKKRDAPGLTLAPNVNGERVDTWGEAQKLAESKGKDTASYDAKIREERNK